MNHLQFRFFDTTGLKLEAREVFASIFWFLVGSSPAVALAAFQVWG